MLSNQLLINSRKEQPEGGKSIPY